jgi:flagellar biosynthesis anti-sigma factor FlgM
VANDSASISQLATQLGNFPAVRQGRVGALRRAVQSGSYQVDAGQVAQSMLGELFGAGSKS